MNNNLTLLFERLVELRAKLNFETQIENQIKAFVANEHLALIQGSLNGLSIEQQKDIGSQIADFFKNPMQTRSLIDSKELSIVAAFFQAPYAPRLGFEVFEYNLLEPTQEIKLKYPSIAKPIELIRCSDGLRPSRTVALFPENWTSKHKNKIEEEDQVFYFIDKFVNRFFDITKCLIDRCCDSESFSYLTSATEQEIQLACTNWVTLHEHFHRQGQLPLPDFLQFKDNRSAAALEELRVDMLTLRALSEMQTISHREKQINREFILAERLLRYATEADVSNDYDAIGTQVFFNFLIYQGAIQISDGKLSISKEIFKFVELFGNSLIGLEKMSWAAACKMGRKTFTDFAKQWGGFSISENKYIAHDFFKNCKQVYQNKSADEATDKSKISSDMRKRKKAA